MIRLHVGGFVRGMATEKGPKKSNHHVDVGFINRKGIGLYIISLTKYA